MAVRNKFNLGATITALNKTKRELPIKIANLTRNFFLNSFRQQGFTDAVENKWKEVQRRIPGTPAFKYPKKKQLSRRTSPILVRTGKLRREVSNSIRNATWEEIRLGVSDATPYAEAQNDGTKHIPKRKFMGKSRMLTVQTKEKIRKEILLSLRK